MAVFFIYRLTAKIFDLRRYIYIGVNYTIEEKNIKFGMF